MEGSTGHHNSRCKVADDGKDEDRFMQLFLVLQIRPQSASIEAYYTPLMAANKLNLL